jgi:hypothetical protein
MIMEENTSCKIGVMQTYTSLLCKHCVDAVDALAVPKLWITTIVVQVFSYRNWCSVVRIF